MARDMTPNDEETARGFTRPFRVYYQHIACGNTNRLGRDPATKLATDPTSFAVLHCPSCREPFPLDHFVWVDNREDGNPGLPGDATAYPVGS